MRYGIYELEDEIGAGGFGRVYRARHTELEVTRAVKVATDAEYVRLLRKEGKMLARLQHPRIVQIHDMNTAHEPPYIVMEYLPGGDLRAKLASGPLAVDEAIRIMLDVLDALEHAHGKGIIHRDLKPSNILLDAEGRAKVADFGLGRMVDEGSMSAAQMSALRSKSGAGANDADSSAGTLKYMSPEQMDPSLLHGAALDGRSDLYSLGLVFYELLTGEFPLGLRPPMPSEMRPDISAEFDRILCKMLLAKYSDRYANAAEVRDAINAYAAAHLRQETEPVIPAKSNKPTRPASGTDASGDRPLPAAPPPPSSAFYSPTAPDYDFTTPRPTAPPPPQAVPVPTSPGNNRFAMCSLMCAISGPCTCGLGSLFGLIFGIIALVQIKNNQQDVKGKGLAISGIVISLVLIVAAVIGCIYLFANHQNTNSYHNPLFPN